MSSVLLKVTAMNFISTSYRLYLITADNHLHRLMEKEETCVIIPPIGDTEWIYTALIKLMLIEC